MANFLMKAPAKINLFLHIVGKDNYYLYESLFVFVKFYDILEIRTNARNTYVYFINDKGIINKYNNTIVKAVNLLSNHTPHPLHLSVKVIKNILISAGLAGGSANAAAVLRAIGNLYNIDDNILQNIAFEVGSDVPACLKSKPVFVESKGEKLSYPLNFEMPKYILLVNPRRPISTTKVFANYNGSFSHKISTLPNNKEEWWNLIKESKNDLLNTAIELAPEIQDILSILSQQNGCILSRMSGSGATCFGVFQEEKQAISAAQSIKKLHPRWWIQNTEVIL